ncbi:MAG TPA: hypothetical protein VF669_20165 [Tepidisphaeraceae bacterium]|jgi:hypothetical protein
MPGMNKHSRTASLIESMMVALESGATEAEALVLLDELRRLERKWNEQVQNKSPRRVPADFQYLAGWYRRWLLATKTLAASNPTSPLSLQRQQVERHLSQQRPM